MKLFTKLVPIGLMATFVTSVLAAPSADEIKQLGTTLTPWGALKAGNADGTIPAYTGGMTTPPSGYDPAAGKWVDPFPTDKPRFSIAAANVSQHAGQLTPGTQEMLKRFSSMRVDVYPTHRLYWQAKEFQDGAIKNAQNPNCKLEGGGSDLKGCFAGVPFPIPKTGYEVMWNHLTRLRPNSVANSDGWLVNSAGSRTLLLQSEVRSELPYWDPKEKPFSGAGQYVQRFVSLTVGPPRDAGNMAMTFYPLEYTTTGQKTWSYSTGQRRVRLAPEFTYDTPIAQLGGGIFFDEIGLLSGKLDRFDFKLVGLKEMIIPSNNYRLYTATSAEQLLGAQHVNPDLMRWELRRVWVVEAVNKAEARHAASKRTFYVEEDSWAMMASESYDQAGKIFRVMYANAVPSYATGGIADCNSSIQAYDLARGQYLYLSTYVGKQNFCKVGVPRLKPGELTPDALAGRGVR